MCHQHVPAVVNSAIASSCATAVTQLREHIFDGVVICTIPCLHSYNICNTGKINRFEVATLTDGLRHPVHLTRAGIFNKLLSIHCTSRRHHSTLVKTSNYRLVDNHNQVRFLLEPSIAGAASM